MITRESVEKKLGFDIFNPPLPENGSLDVDDATPSIWSPLTRAELAFVIELYTGQKLPA